MEITVNLNPSRINDQVTYPLLKASKIGKFTIIFLSLDKEQSPKNLLYTDIQASDYYHPTSMKIRSTERVNIIVYER